MIEARTKQRRRSRPGPGVETLEGRELMSVASLPAAPRAAAAAVQVRNAQPPAPTPSRWSWLADTYWYVPTASLPAVTFDAGTGALAGVADQTVYHLSGYRKGYFWGETVSQFGPSAPTSSSVIGSVTPQGRILLSFTSTSGVTTQGIGIMIRKGGRWTMENQMFTATTSGTQVGHWAYMAQTRPGMRSWNALPLAGVSVPTFLAQYNAPTPTPNSAG